jgi:beta-glucosidase
MNPSGRLPITFPRGADQLPRPSVPGRNVPDRTLIDVDYPEGANLGYRGFEAKGQKPLFPFGYGLSYASFRYSGFTVRGGKALSASFVVTNTGPRAGAEVAQVYAAPPGGTRRLIDWKKLDLKPGETRRVTVTADPRLLAVFDKAAHDWKLAAGTYRVVVGANAEDAALSGSARLGARRMAP